MARLLKQISAECCAGVTTVCIFPTLAISHAYPHQTELCDSCSHTSASVSALLQAPRKFASGVAERMGYEDFVWFILCEEDKTTEPSLEYWFK